MEFPNLPTDSLYKFLAIAGLFGVAFCVWLYYSRLGELVELLSSLSMTAEDAKAGVRVSQHKLEKLGGLPGDERTARVAELGAEAVDLRNEVERLKAKARQDMGAVKRLTQVQRASRVGGTISVAIALIGFTLWYFQVQRFQDVILRGTADSILAVRRLAPAGVGDSVRLLHPLRLSAPDDIPLKHPGGER